MTEARLFSRHSIGTRIAALFMLLILVITAAMTYVSISVSTNELLDSSTEYTEQLIRRVNAELDMNFDSLVELGLCSLDNQIHRVSDLVLHAAVDQLRAVDVLFTFKQCNILLSGDAE